MEFFDPDNVGVANGNYFGLPVTPDEASLIFLPVPWDATVSYGKGTADGPEAMLEASLQIDLFDERIPRAWEMSAAALPCDAALRKDGEQARKAAEKVIGELAAGVPQDRLESLAAKVNEASERMNSHVYGTSSEYLSRGKTVAVIGGDHSVPLGLFRAEAEAFGGFGILHIDAHADLRKAYEGFRYSHASIMYNALEGIPEVSRIVQVGIRDYCRSEHELAVSSDRVGMFSDRAIKEAMFDGRTWRKICGQIIESLPENVHISFDIDGLSPEYCPSTGTPVPGGLSFSQADYLLFLLAVSGKRIIGFDLCEVAPSGRDEWDANVGARMLFKLALYTLFSGKRL